MFHVLDFCAGAGGLAQGFEEGNYRVTAVDICDTALETYKLNFKGNCVKADLSTDFVHMDCDILIGGPPCRPWSSVNLSRRGKKHKDYNLLSKYFEHIEKNNPQTFIMENVPTIAHDKLLLKNIKKLRKAGYSVTPEIITYSDYGAPTKRRRYILVGVMGRDSGLFFKELAKHKTPAKSVKDAIGDLRYKERGEVEDHEWPDLKTIEKYLPYYRTHKYGWYILDWGKPAPSFGNVMKTYILHPDSFNGGITRVISVRETSRIMGFDTSFRFPQGAGLGMRYQMIVDSVSPVFSRLAADIIKQLMPY